MGIAVEEAVHQHHVEDHGGRAASEGHAVDGRGVQGADVVDRDAGEPLHGEDAGGDRLPVDERHLQPGASGEVGGDPLGVVALARVVQFAGNLAVELLDEPQQVEVPGPFEAMLQLRGDRPQDVDVRAQLIGHAAALHLHDDLTPVRQAGGVGLPDRRRTQRQFVERGEQVRQRRTQLGLDGPPDAVERLGGHPRAKRRQLAGEVGGHQVRPGRQDLPELDEGGAELLEGPAHDGRGAEGGVHARLVRGERPDDCSARPGLVQPGRRSEDPEPVAGQDPEDLALSLQVRGHASTVATRPRTRVCPGSRSRGTRGSGAVRPQRGSPRAAGRPWRSSGWRR